LATPARRRPRARRPPSPTRVRACPGTLPQVSCTRHAVVGALGALSGLDSSSSVNAVEVLMLSGLWACRSASAGERRGRMRRQEDCRGLRLLVTNFCIAAQLRLPCIGLHGCRQGRQCSAPAKRTAQGSLCDSARLGLFPWCTPRAERRGRAGGREERAEPGAAGGSDGEGADSEAAAAAAAFDEEGDLEISE